MWGKRSPVATIVSSESGVGVGLGSGVGEGDAGVDGELAPVEGSADGEELATGVCDDCWVSANAPAPTVASAMAATARALPTTGVLGAVRACLATGER